MRKVWLLPSWWNKQAFILPWRGYPQMGVVWICGERGIMRRVHLQRSSTPSALKLMQMCSLNHTLVPSVAPPTCRASFSNIKGIILQFYSQLWFNEPVKWSPTKCGWRKFIALSVSGSSYWQSCVTSLEPCHLSKHHEFSEFAFVEKQHFCTFWPRWHNPLPYFQN